MNNIGIAFDIDGTLLQSTDIVRNLYNSIFYDFYGEDDSLHLVPCMGLTDSQIVSAVLTKIGEPLGDISIIKNEFINRYIRIVGSSLSLMPYVSEALIDLSKITPLDIITGNWECLAIYKLFNAGVHKYFRELYHCDLYTSKNEMFISLKSKNPSQKLFYICDTVQDAISAKKNDINPILVNEALSNNLQIKEKLMVPIIPDMSVLEKTLHFYMQDKIVL